MKEQIFEKIKNALVCYNIANQNVNEAYDVLISSKPRVFDMLSRFYGLNEEEEKFAWSAGIAQIIPSRITAIFVLANINNDGST